MAKCIAYTSCSSKKRCGNLALFPDKKYIKEYSATYPDSKNNNVFFINHNKHKDEKTNDLIVFPYYCKKHWEILMSCGEKNGYGEFCNLCIDVKLKDRKKDGHGNTEYIPKKYVGCPHIDEETYPETKYTYEDELCKDDQLDGELLDSPQGQRTWNLANPGTTVPMPIIKPSRAPDASIHGALLPSIAYTGKGLGPKPTTSKFTDTEDMTTEYDEADEEEENLEQGSSDESEIEFEVPKRLKRRHSTKFPKPITKRVPRVFEEKPRERGLPAFKFDKNTPIILHTIDITNSLDEAKRNIKIFIDKIRADRGNTNIGTRKKELDNPYTFEVEEKVITNFGKLLTNYMSNYLRIEMILCYLFDFEARDLTLPLSYFGFRGVNASSKLESQIEPKNTSEPKIQPPRRITDSNAKPI